MALSQRDARVIIAAQSQGGLHDIRHDARDARDHRSSGEWTRASCHGGSGNVHGNCVTTHDRVVNSQERCGMQSLTRRQQLNDIGRMLDAVADGESRVLWLEGDAGSGKTHLLDEIGGSARTRGMRVLRAGFAGPTGAEPYRAVGEMVAEAMGTVSPEEEARARTWFKSNGAKFVDSFGEILAVIPGFAVGAAVYKIARITAGDRILGTEDPPSTVPRYPQQRVPLLRDLLLNDPGAAVIAIDDAQWVDSGTEEVIAALIAKLAKEPRTPGPRLLVIVVRGTDLSSGAIDRLEMVCARHLSESAKAWHRTRLAPLSASEMDDVAEHLFGRPCAFDPPFREWLRSTTSGNPLGVRGLLSALRDAGLVSHDEGRVVARLQPSPTGEVPPWLARVARGVEGGRGAVEGEIRMLPSAVRRFLEAAAAWRRSFPTEPTAAMAGLSRGETLDVLRDCERRGIVVRALDRAGMAGTTEHWSRFSSETWGTVLGRNTPASTLAMHARSIGKWWSVRATTICNAIRLEWEACDAGSDDRWCEAGRQLVSAAVEAADQLAMSGARCAGLQVLVDAETTLLDHTLFGNREENDVQRADRQVQRTLLSLLAQSSARFDRHATTMVSWPPDYRAFRGLELTHHLAVARTWAGLEWYTRALGSLRRAHELVADGADDADWLKFLRVTADVHSSRGAIGECRTAIREYYERFVAHPPEDAELGSILDAVAGWPSCVERNSLVEFLRALPGWDQEERLPARISIELDRLHPPWDVDNVDEMCSLIEAADAGEFRTISTLLLATVENYWPDDDQEEDGITPSVVEDAIRLVHLLDTTERLVRTQGDLRCANQLALASYDVLQDQVDSLERYDDEWDIRDLVDLTGELSETFSPLLQQMRVERLERIRALGGTRPSGHFLIALIRNTLVGDDEAWEMLETSLGGPVTGELVRAVSAMGDRLAESGPRLQQLLGWLNRERAKLGPESAVLGDILEALAEIHEVMGDPLQGARCLLEAARAVQGKEPARWRALTKRAHQMCEGKADGLQAMLEEGALSASSLEPLDLAHEIPEDLLAREDLAEWSIAKAGDAIEPSDAVALYERAISIYTSIPDGLTRCDDIHELVFDHLSWAAWDERDLARRTALMNDAEQALIRAVSVNEELGDLRRIAALNTKLFEACIERIDLGVDVLVATAVARAQEAFEVAVSCELFDEAGEALDAVEVALWRVLGEEGEDDDDYENQEEYDDCEDDEDDEDDDEAEDEYGDEAEDEDDDTLTGEVEPSVPMVDTAPFREALRAFLEAARARLRHEDDDADEDDAEEDDDDDDDAALIPIPDLVQAALRSEGRVASADVRAAFDCDSAEAREYLRDWVDAGWLVRRGAGRGTHYIAGDLD